MNKRTVPPSSLPITQAITAGATSPEHKRFKTLLEKTDKARLRLQQWQDQLPLFAQSWRERVTPQAQRLAQARQAWVLEMEQLLLGRKWSKADAQTLQRALVDLCETLLQNDESNAELKALFNRHAEVDYDSQGQEDLSEMKHMLEQMGGMDLGDEAPESADDLLQRAHEQMAQRMAEEREAQAGAENVRKPQRARKPSKAQAAAQAQADADAQNASKTVREVFRKLAAALHPDRVAAHASAEQRAHSTDLMQQANAAYAAGDLLALLTLQLQIEQVNTAEAAKMASTQVRHFNKVLAEQLRELEAEIDSRQETFELSYGLMAQRRLDPLQLGPIIKDAVRELEDEHLQLAADRRTLGGDPASAKRYLKHLRALHRMQDDGGGFF